MSYHFWGIAQNKKVSNGLGITIITLLMDQAK